MEPNEVGPSIDTTSLFERLTIRLAVGCLVVPRPDIIEFNSRSLSVLGTVSIVTCKFFIAVSVHVCCGRDCRCIRSLMGCFAFDTLERIGLNMLDECPLDRGFTEVDWGVPRCWF